MEIFLMLLLLVYAIFLGYWFIPPLFGAPPFYPSNRKAVREMVKLAQIHKKDRVIDLGSGDGRILFEASKYSDNVFGVELNPFFVYFTKLKSLLLKSNIEVYKKDLYKIDLSEYDIVFCYLLPETMTKLKQKFNKELKPGTKVITNTFHLDAFKQIGEIDKLIIYRVE